MKIILLAIIIGIIILILFNKKCKTNENFINIYSNIITFSTLDNILIKRYIVNSYYSLYDNELIELFNFDSFDSQINELASNFINDNL